MDGHFISDLSIVLEQNDYRLINLFVEPDGIIKIEVKKNDN
jgi:hypothetical protein